MKISKIKGAFRLLFSYYKIYYENGVVIINKIMNFAAIGGDLRQIQVINSIAEAGHKISVYGFEKCKENYFHSHVKRCNSAFDAVDFAEIVILPLPYTTNGTTVNAPFCSDDLTVESVVKTLQQGKQLFVGKVDEKIQKLCETYEIHYVDYFDREELTIANAIPTAEGAIAVAMKETPFTLHGSNCLCLGFGRIGKILSKMLFGIGANVSVAARKTSDFAWCQAFGYTSIHVEKLEEAVGNYDIIFNTIPHLILDFNLLSKVKRDVLIVDLASKPGGVSLIYDKVFTHES